jgi:hypothetical protein
MRCTREEQAAHVIPVTGMRTVWRDESAGVFIGGLTRVLRVRVAGSSYVVATTG